MEKNKLLILPFFAGLVLMVCSWYLSYPLSIDFPGDFVFNHVSPLYWFGLPLMLASLYILGAFSKSHSSKCVISVAIIITLYSLSYFYYTLPTSDSQYFRGMTEYFIKTKNLDPSQPSHLYFQWPSFFLLSDMAVSVSGMELAKFEFLLYTIIGFLLATTLYVYAHKAFKKGGFLAVAAFFITMFYFLNYQSVPFSLAFGLLFVLFMLETRQKSFNVIMTMLVLYTGISFIHAFVPLFFVLYLLVRCILNKSKQYGRLFLLTLLIYLVVQVTQAPFSFVNNIRSVFTLPTEYSSIVEATLAPVSVPIDVVAQMFSRAVTITTVAMCLVGFIILLIKRKMRDLDKAIFLTGVVYLVVGSVFFTLGSRTIAIVFIPISLGASYLLGSRFRTYINFLFLVLLILFVFIPFHASFYDSQIMFQTKEVYHTENFMIDHYNWTSQTFILAHVRVITYLQTKQPSLAIFEDDVYSPLFPRLKEYDCMVYTVGLGKNLLNYNYTTERILREEILNVVYNNGFSYIAIKS
jgi:hypothetical protein